MTTAPGIEPIADARPVSIELKEVEIYQRTWGIKSRVDPNATFEEFAYWAQVEREEEREANRLYVEERGPLTFTKAIKGRFSKGIHHENKKKQQLQQVQQTLEGVNGKDETHETEAIEPTPPGAVTPEEWKQAARALRTAGWGTVFYLITTDILGWSSTAFVYASLGFGPATVLYIIFGAFAGFSGWILWKVFLHLDSSRYPLMSFGDAYFRVYGAKARHFINVGQSLQMFMTVSVLILSNGTTIAQLAQEKLCFVVCMVICTIVGILLGSIRSLQRIGWLANLSVWLNIASFLMIMVAAANFPIDYDAVTQSTLIKTVGPVRTFAGPPPSEFQQQAAGFAGQFNGINSLVYSWGGALLFIAFLAEMRHPMDFWKGLMCAQLFIGIVYVLFGAFVYSNYGQYSASNIGNVIQPLRLQTVNNSISLITAAIACLMYFNIGMKVVYMEVGQEVFNLPDITTRKGKWLWYALTPIYWIIAFIVAAAVPNINGIANLVGALLILNFTYTFPALLFLGFRCQIDAALPGEGFDPRTGVTTRHDSGYKRWVRGFTKRWYVNLFTLIYFLGGLATSGMGSWAAIEGLIQVFGPSGTVASSFGCGVPV